MLAKRNGNDSPKEDLANPAEFFFQITRLYRLRSGQSRKGQDYTQIIVQLIANIILAADLHPDPHVSFSLQVQRTDLP